jgi:hypothetical protein
VDELTRRLFALRQRLMTEIRASDDATAARMDALLARPLRQEHGECQAAGPDACDCTGEPDPPEPLD